MPKATSSGGADIAPIPAGTHLGVCYGVIDVGTPPPSGNFPSRRKVLLMFELPDVRGEFVIDGKPKDCARVISVDYTLSTSKKSNLRRHLAAWRGRDFTEDEAKAFEVANVAGAMALLSVVHKKSADGTKTFANITAIMKPMAGTPRLEPENAKLIFDIPPQGVITIPDMLPEWIANRIKASDEYVASTNQQTAGGGNRPTDKQLANQADNLDEDVPF